MFIFAECRRHKYLGATSASPLLDLTCTNGFSAFATGVHLHNTAVLPFQTHDSCSLTDEGTYEDGQRQTKNVAFNFTREFLMRFPFAIVPAYSSGLSFSLELPLLEGPISPRKERWCFAFSHRGTIGTAVESPVACHVQFQVIYTDWIPNAHTRCQVKTGVDLLLATSRNVPAGDKSGVSL